MGRGYKAVFFFFGGGFGSIHPLKKIWQHIGIKGSNYWVLEPKLNLSVALKDKQFFSFSFLEVLKLIQVP